MLTSAAPLQFSVGGDVKIACSSRYSQLPVNGRVDTTYARVTSSGPAWLTIIMGSRSASFPDSPSGSGDAVSGTTARNKPNPVAWSYAITRAGRTRPRWSTRLTSSASTIR